MFAAAVASARLLAAGNVIVTELMYHPASGDPREEYLELFNRSSNTYNLGGWQFTSGVDFTFPAVVLRPGAYLAVAADLAVFTNKYPGITNVVGGWQGRLGHHGQTLRLQNPFGQLESTATYATGGDWGVRQRGPNDRGHWGWVWVAETDGGGKSLELINPVLGNQYGQNWAASRGSGGTPGRPNSVAQTNVAPLILGVGHYPVVPRSTDAVAITAHILDESPFGVTARLFYRVDGEPAFSSTPMADDGQHGDGAPADGVFGALLPARPNNTIVEFYVSATDAQGNTRTWPAPVQPAGTQAANCLYQVDDSVYDGTQPLHRLITTEAERLELADIGAMVWSWSSGAQMNATFISTEAGHTELRYLTGFRIRGSTARAYVTKSRRVNFPDDHPWHGQRAINLNALNPHSDILGRVLYRLAGVPAQMARAVQVRENNRQLAGTNPNPYGFYAEVEVFDNEFAKAHFPLDSAGNLYRVDGGNLNYLGEDPNTYRTYMVSGYVYRLYTKKTNSSDDDWTDLIGLTRVLNTTPDNNYVQAVRSVANVEEWVRYFAVNMLVGNSETALGTGSEGDCALYRGVVDPRFLLLDRDFNAMVGTGGGVDRNIRCATNQPAVYRFLKTPEFASKYYAELQHQADTTFATANVNALIEQFMGGVLPASDIQQMKDFMAARRQSVLSQIPATFTVASSLPSVAYFPHTTSPLTELSGTADLARTSQVLVNGRQAVWNPLNASWTISNVALLPGVNRVIVEAIDTHGQTVNSTSIRIWYDSGTSTPVSGTLATDALWKAVNGPYHVTSDLVVPAGVTLTIEPGTSVFFEWQKRLYVFGRLLAEGTPYQRIWFAKPPLNEGGWNGIAFSGATNENRLAYFDMAFLGYTPISMTNSCVLVDHGAWEYNNWGFILFYDSSLTVRNCVFPSLYYNGTIAGMGMPADGHVIIEGNYFNPTLAGDQDIINFSGGQRPGPILQVYNNIFAGGDDDGIDINGSDAHIEGNLLMHFHKLPTSTSTGEAGAVAPDFTKLPGRADTSHPVIVRNVFYDNDTDIVLKEDAVVLAQNNTFVSSKKGSLMFTEPLRPWEREPKKVLLEGNIFWNEPAVMANLNPSLVTNGTIEVRVDYSILPEPGPWSGQGNLNADPLFVNPTNDFHLRPGSPAIGAGPQGFDMGAYVPPGPWISGEPPAETWRTDATLTVGGPGITHFKYRVNDGPFSEELPLDTPIELSGLANGPYTVFAVGKNSAGVWQADTNATASRTWRVNTRLRGVRLNEVLAQNVTAVAVNVGFPDLVELHNVGAQAADLSGLSLTDDRTQPAKFTFPPGASLAADSYLVLIADNHTNAPGLHLGFALDADGEGLFLYDSLNNGGDLLDSVSFGPQLPDLSVGRLSDALWHLTQPTFGGPNRPQLLGDPARLKINEWLANCGTVQHEDFVELYNPESRPVALGGLSLSDQPVGAPGRHVIAPLSFIRPGGFLVFVADGQADKKPNHLNFKLSAEQGMIGLFDTDGTAIDVVAYGFQLPDISEGRSPSGSSTVASFVLPTPGGEASSSGDPRFVVINEVLACNSSSPSAGADLPDWVELYNRSTNAIDLSGMSLADKFDAPLRWEFPAGASIPPLGCLVIGCDGEAPPSGTNTGFGLSAEGDAVYLFDARGGLVDGVVFGLQTAKLSIGRIPDGTGAWRLNQMTPGWPNAETAVGVPGGLKINEWMANPATGDDWFEIYNPGGLPLDLSGLYLTDDLNQPQQHQIPPLSFIGMGPYGYQLFVADGNSAAGANHVGFKLASEGEELGLATINGFFLDRVLFGAQVRGVSQGRYPDGVESIASFPTSASPGRANTYNSPPVLLPIADQFVAPGETLRLTFAALDSDRPAQRLTLSLGSISPPGASFDPLTGVFSWTPPETQPPGPVRLKVTVTDDGVPNLSASQTVSINVTGPVGPRLGLVVGGGIARLSWTAKLNRTYLLEFKNDLNEPAWALLSEARALGTNVAFVDIMGNSPECFYRLTLLP
jgi:hypothetical protein